MRIRVVTDTACDVPPDLQQKHQIRVLPAYIQFGLQSYRDNGVDITREQFYERLRASSVSPTTATFPPGDAETVYQKLLQETDHIISVHLAGNLSGILASAKVAAETVAPDKITVVDSAQASMAAGFMAVMAAEMAEQGAEVSAIVEAIEATRERTTLWAAPETLEFLRRSGRISWLTAGMGTLLQIKPMVKVYQGEVIQVGRVRTFKNAFKELVARARREVPLERLAILHLDNPGMAEQLRQELSDIAPPDTPIIWASSAIAVHFGPGGLGVATMRKKT